MDRVYAVYDVYELVMLFTLFFCQNRLGKGEPKQEG
jgi:hypothetical protein